MSKYLTQGKRYHIESYKKAGFRNKYIAKEIGVHPSTTSRKLKRNSSPIHQSYGAASAHEITTLRKSINSSIPSKIKVDTLVLIDEYIQMDWSPEQVSAILQIKHNISISFGLIRQYIPKGRNFTGITQKDIQEIEDKINHRPRKSRLENTI